MDYRIVRRRRLPFAPWDVMLARPLVTAVDPLRMEERLDRVVSGFWTRRGAQRWIDRERGQA